MSVFCGSIIIVSVRGACCSAESDTLCGTLDSRFTFRNWKSQIVDLWVIPGTDYGHDGLVFCWPIRVWSSHKDDQFHFYFENIAGHPGKSEIHSPDWQLCVSESVCGCSQCTSGVPGEALMILVVEFLSWGQHRRCAQPRSDSPRSWSVHCWVRCLRVLSSQCSHQACTFNFASLTSKINHKTVYVTALFTLMS